MANVRDSYEWALSSVRRLVHSGPRPARSLADEARDLVGQSGPKKVVVIGLGTGRSGTVSLSRLLDAQTSSSVQHELRPLLPWLFDENQIQRRLDEFSSRSDHIVGDVAHYYLPYVRHIAANFPDAKFVCTRREREAVIDSIMLKTKNDNHWADHDGSEWTQNDEWGRTMPSYSSMSKRDALGRYWDEYNAEALVLTQELGDAFEIFDLEETFHDETEVRRLLDHVGIERDDQNAVLNIHENAHRRSPDA